MVVALFLLFTLKCESNCFLCGFFSLCIFVLYVYMFLSVLLLFFFLFFLFNSSLLVQWNDTFYIHVGIYVKLWFFLWKFNKSFEYFRSMYFVWKIGALICILYIVVYLHGDHRKRHYDDMCVCCISEHQYAAWFQHP